MKVGFPWSLIEPALVGRTSSVADVPWTFRDASMLGLVAETPVISYDEFQRAIDRRALRKVRSLRERDVATAVVGSPAGKSAALGTIVRLVGGFRAAHVVFGSTARSARRVVVEEGLVRELTLWGANAVKAEPELRDNGRGTRRLWAATRRPPTGRALGGCPPSGASGGSPYGGAFSARNRRSARISRLSVRS